MTWMDIVKLDDADWFSVLKDMREALNQELQEKQRALENRKAAEKAKKTQEMISRTNQMTRKPANLPALQGDTPSARLANLKRERGVDEARMQMDNQAPMFSQQALQYYSDPKNVNLTQQELADLEDPSKMTDDERAFEFERQKREGKLNPFTAGKDFGVETPKIKRKLGRPETIDMDRQLVARPADSAKERRAARRAEHSSTSAFMAAHKKRQKENADRRKKFTEMQAAIEAETDKDKKENLKLEFDKFKRENYGQDRTKPQVGNIAQVTNTNRMNELKRQKSKLDAERYQTKEGSLRRRDIDANLERIENEMKQLNQSVYGFATDYDAESPFLKPEARANWAAAQSASTDTQATNTQSTTAKPTGAGTVQPTLQQTMARLPDRVPGDPNQKKLFTKDPRTGDLTFNPFSFGKSWKDELRR